MLDGRTPQRKPQSLYQSPWLPVGLLVVTTAALGVPLVLLRRAKRNPLPTAPPRRPAMSAQGLAVTRAPIAPSAISASQESRIIPEYSAPTEASSSGAPPPRRAARFAITPATLGHPSKLPSTSTPLSSAVSVYGKDEEKELPKQPLEFNVTFYAFRAFAIATGAVCAGAAATVFSVRYSLGIDDPKEFARWARWTFATRLPWLYSRMRRPVIPDAEMTDPQTEPWTWEGAEARMQEAWESKGLVAWAEVAAQEVEAESREERLRGWRGSPQSPRVV